MKAMFQSWHGKVMLSLIGSLFLILSVACESEVKAQTLDKTASNKEHVQVDDMPKPKNLAQIYATIGYPKEAAEKNIQGKVFVKILVDTDGTYMKHEILKADHEILKAAVEPHVGELMFTPGTKNGQAVKTWVTLPFTFKM